MMSGHKAYESKAEKETLFLRLLNGNVSVAWVIRVYSKIFLSILQIASQVEEYTSSHQVGPPYGFLALP
jgi:hypothetical protein